MRHFNCVPLAVLAIALCVSPAAAAHDRPADGGAVVTPSSPHQLAQWYSTFLEMPAAVNPLWGTGDDPCVRFGPGGKLLSAISFGEVTCTAELGTVLDTGWGHFCSTFEFDVGTEFYAVGKREQRRCAKAVSQEETGMRVTVDDGPTVDMFRPRFTMFSPQTTVQLPADNVWGAAAQTGTVTAYGWHANIRNLRVGRHVITTEIDAFGETFPFHHIINIVPRGHSDDDN
jgi:hypothetical protein